MFKVNNNNTRTLFKNILFKNICSRTQEHMFKVNNNNTRTLLKNVALISSVLALKRYLTIGIVRVTKGKPWEQGFSFYFTFSLMVIR